MMQRGGFRCQGDTSCAAEPPAVGRGRKACSGGRGPGDWGFGLHGTACQSGLGTTCTHLLAMGGCCAD